MCPFCLCTNIHIQFTNIFPCIFVLHRLLSKGQLIFLKDTCKQWACNNVSDANRSTGDVTLKGTTNIPIGQEDHSQTGMNSQDVRELVVVVLVQT